ncbi:MAG: hypothetical protein Q8O67_28390 [Deltaproteobacteria bacterium]|nr:hypothetical protein [Deltaproteobacteria bacterium]
MDCPKEVVIWNYYDHEHIVGTHYKWYRHFKIVAEENHWCLVERFYKLPVINFKTSSLGFMYMKNPDLIHSIQYGKFGTVLDQQLHLKALGPDRCLVTSEYSMEVPRHLELLLQPLFHRVTTRWFHNTWEEDAPMRLRRWKVWKLGFRDFRGVGFINDKTARPVDDVAPPYPLDIPVAKTPEAPPGSGYTRPFETSVEIGYRDGE